MLITLRKLQQVDKFEDKSWIRTRLILMKCQIISKLENISEIDEENMEQIQSEEQVESKK